MQRLNPDLRRLAASLRSHTRPASGTRLVQPKRQQLARTLTVGATFRILPKASHA